MASAAATASLTGREDDVPSVFEEGRGLGRTHRYRRQPMLKGRQQRRMPRRCSSGKPIIRLKPNRLPDYRPKTEALLHVFRHTTFTQGSWPSIRLIVIIPLNLPQTHILELLGLEEAIYTLDHLSRPLDELDSS